MAVVIVNVPVSNSAKFLCTVVPNSTTEFSIGGTGTSYVAIGLSSGVTTAKGFAISPGIPHVFTLPSGSKSYDIYGIANVAGPVQLGIVMTTTA